jgi:hypothetical protein
MLALSSQAFAFYKGTDATKIMMKGKVVAEHWGKNNTHHTRVVYKGTYYACLTFIESLGLKAYCYNTK